MSHTPILQLRDVKIAYGAIEAVKGISLELAKGELVSLIGANGAGKTTTLNAIAGTLGVSAGELLYDGKRIEKLPAHKRLRQGLALVPEGRGIFTRLTVEENLRMGAYCRRDNEAIEADMERVFTMLPRVKERLQQVAGTLSGGEQQMVAIGRALMTNPALILLDEATEGLAPRIAALIWDVITQIRSDGIATLIVDRNYRQVSEHADRLLVLQKGQVVLAGSAAELRHGPELARYLGL